MTATIVDADGQCLIGSPDARAGDCDGVPPGHRPSPGQCRVWYPDTPPGQQPPPFDCDDEGDSGDIVFIARALPRWLEFDGKDTIFGTPRQEDAGTHRVRLQARHDDDQVNQDFTLDVDPAPTAPPPEGADLAASLAVTPASAYVGDPITWSATVRNLADSDVANIGLETEFSGDASFNVAEVDDAACSIEPRGTSTAVVCRWSPLPRATARSVQIRGTVSAAGDIRAVATASIVDTVPIDRNAANDSTSVVLGVTERDPAEVSVDEPPVLTLNGPSLITLIVGKTYQDPGATAADKPDGNLTSKIVVDNPVDTSIIGRYSVTYDVVDSAGNGSTATRTVEIVPREGVGGGGGGSAGLTLLLLFWFGVFARARESLAAAGRERPAFRIGGLGWTMGLEPTTTGITTRGSTN